MSDVQTVTGDTLDAFHVERLGLAQPEKAVTLEPGDVVTIEGELGEIHIPKESEESEESEETHDPAEEHGPDEPKKKPSKIELRFSELTTQREQAKAEATANRERAERAEREAAELRAKIEPPKPAEPQGEPKPSEFSDAFEYAKALAEYSVQKALAKRDQDEAERTVQAEREKVIIGWNDRMKATQAEIPDYKAVVDASAVQVSQQVRDAIIESDAGPKILYHLASNPQEAERINKLSVASALREIGRIEAKLEGPSTKPAVEPKPVPKPVATITPIKGSSVVDVPVTADGEYKGTFEQYKALRAAGKI